MNHVCIDPPSECNRTASCDVDYGRESGLDRVILEGLSVQNQYAYGQNVRQRVTDDQSSGVLSERRRELIHIARDDDDIVWGVIG
jgi:hypothetical protein